MIMVASAEFSYLVLLCLSIEVLSTALPYKNNVECHPYNKIIAVPNRISPYFINVSHCQGGEQGKSIGPNRICKAVSESKQNFTILNEKYDGLEVITVSNHTKCEYACESDASVCNNNQSWDDDTCECKCNIDKSGCGENRALDVHRCNCYCNIRCGVGQLVDLGKCRCYCNIQCEETQQVDPERCMCVPPQPTYEPPMSGGLATGYVFLVIFIELFVVVAVCVFIVHRYFNKKSKNLETIEKTHLTSNDVEKVNLDV